MSDFAELMGPSYTIQGASSVECQRTLNWRLERVVSGAGKNLFTLLREPGLRTFCNTALNAKSRGLFALNGHCYGVVGTHVLEFLADGTFIDYTATFGINVTEDGKKVWFAASPVQLMIVGGGNGYVLGAPGGLVQIADPDFPTGSAAACSFLDGYFIVTIKDSQQFQVSALNDALTWDASKVSEVESRPDFLVAPIDLKEEVWFFGTETIQPYYNNGDPAFPFAPNQSAIINSGLMAAQSLCRIGNTLFWLKIDENGHGTFCKNEGYVDVEISNHAVESIWNTYDNLADTYCWAYQENGHECVRLNFTTTNEGSGTATWQYDKATGQWTEISFFNEATGLHEAHRGFCCAVSFDKILVGDRDNGKIYEMHSDFTDDDGYEIVRIRRAPHLYSNKKRIFYHAIEFDGNTGIGQNTFPVFTTTAPATFAATLAVLVAGGTLTAAQSTAMQAGLNGTLLILDDIVSISRGNYAIALAALSLTVDPSPYLYADRLDPLMTLRWSNNGGKVFVGSEQLSWGQIGDYEIRPKLDCFGEARDRVIEIETSAAVDWAIAACAMDYTVGKN